MHSINSILLQLAAISITVAVSIHQSIATKMIRTKKNATHKTLDFCNNGNIARTQNRSFENINTSIKHTEKTSVYCYSIVWLFQKFVVTLLQSFHAVSIWSHFTFSGICFFFFSIHNSIFNHIIHCSVWENRRNFSANIFFVFVFNSNEFYLIHKTTLYLYWTLFFPGQNRKLQQTKTKTT